MQFVQNCANIANVRRLCQQINLIVVSLCRVAKIVVAGLGGSGDRERKWKGKIHPRELKMVFLFTLNMVKNGPEMY